MQFSTAELISIVGRAITGADLLTETLLNQGDIDSAAHVKTASTALHAALVSISCTGAQDSYLARTERPRTTQANCGRVVPIEQMGGNVAEFPLSIAALDRLAAIAAGEANSFPCDTNPPETAA